MIISLSAENVKENLKRLLHCFGVQKLFSSCSSCAGALLVLPEKLRPADERAQTDFYSIPNSFFTADCICGAERYAWIIFASSSVSSVDIVSLFSQPIRYAGETLKSSAIFSILSDGIFVIIPFSYLYMFCFVVLMISASSSCVVPFFNLSVFILVPIVIVNTLLLYDNILEKLPVCSLQEVLRDCILPGVNKRTL